MYEETWQFDEILVVSVARIMKGETHGGFFLGGAVRIYEEQTS